MIKTFEKPSELKLFRRDYLEGVKTFKMPNETTHEFKGTYNKNPSHPNVTKQEEVELEKEKENPKASMNNQSLAPQPQHSNHSLRRGVYILLT
ncbi:hypothetical protein BKP45_20695 [Anaerobacillus alkalidiazotrophicus]|uniref:Uncharacterized protein n=1 Tax=Anaerobacillus alkalidiazotrophicus TaxID=472963 RepID=A0A1S2M0E5_9BACI|nr:hypothetical protein [Anaerobacillus alkalidiazotrophicus]OIJ17973.1 hypothetical protein BKP45_20695 [Anaerobacillus alkalidiazotrophicus]